MTHKQISCIKFLVRVSRTRNLDRLPSALIRHPLLHNCQISESKGRSVIVAPSFIFSIIAPFRNQRALEANWVEKRDQIYHFFVNVIFCKIYGRGKRNVCHYTRTKPICFRRSVSWPGCPSERLQREWQQIQDSGILEGLLHYTNIDWCRGQHWKIMPLSCAMLPSGQCCQRAEGPRVTLHNWGA